jgi:hypothetical protein
MSTAAVARAVVDDPTFYPSTDHVGESTLQVSIAVLLLALIERWLASRGKPVFVGLNTFFYWKQGVPRETVAPDLYVLPGVSLTKRPPSWKVWETGKVPSFALEIVSTEVDKDYVVAPDKYDRLGVRELVVLDPPRPSATGSAPSANAPRLSSHGSGPSSGARGASAEREDGPPQAPREGDQWTSRLTGWLHAPVTLPIVTLTRKLHVLISVRPTTSVFA